MTHIAHRGQRISALLAVATLLFLAGCGGGTTANVQNPPPPPPPSSQLSIAFQPPPVTTLQINNTAALTAVVSNDANNYGVDWSLTCQNPNGCGALSIYHSASGQSVTYTPPQTFPGNSESVSIVAYAATDHTTNTVAPITVSAFGGILFGTYVFEAKGSDANSQPFQLGGAIVLDGNGNVTAGQQTLNYVAGSLTTFISQGSSYFVGADGRGTLTLKTKDQNAQPITENYTLVVLSNSQVLIAESLLDSPQTSAGSMDLQTSTAMPTGSYAFVSSGTDAAGTPTAFGGILNIDSPGGISGKGSLADQDWNNTLLKCVSPNGISGTIAQPNPNPLGTVTFALAAAPCLGTVQFTGYIVDATRIRLIESDNNGFGGYSTAGLAVAQNSAAMPFNLASFSGSYVWGIQGQDLTGLAPSSLTSIGLLTTDGNGNLTDGVTDSFMLIGAITGSPAQARGEFAGTYTTDPQGIGRVRVVLGPFTPPPPFRPQLIFYLTGGGNPALVLDAGGENFNYPSLGAGIAYPQASPPLSFSGEYGVSFTQQNGAENDGTGQMTASNGTLSGVLDDSGGGAGLALSGSFTALDSFERAPGQFPSLIGSTDVLYYLIDANHGFFVETDLVKPGTNQVGMGYFVTRTPVCASCP